MHRSRLPGPLKAAARTASSTFGKTTAGERDLPHFLVIGAQRCGTTSLYRTLALHPQVIPPVFEKGIHYFDTADNFARGLTWYRGHFPLSWTARRRGGAGYRTGEASPYYMFHPTAIERIARVLPEVRLVVMLRDPVERAFLGAQTGDGAGVRDGNVRTSLGARAQSAGRRSGSDAQRCMLPIVFASTPRIRSARRVRQTIGACPPAFSQRPGDGARR